MALRKSYREPPFQKLSGELGCRVQMDWGTVQLRLRPEGAPRAVNNFVYLVNQGFYDGLTFHRVIPGFIAQGGCPLGTGEGDAGFRFTGEVPQAHSYRRGDVALASSGPEDGNGSQFFVCLADQPDLQPQYPLLGRVVSGWEILERIDRVTGDSNGRPDATLTMRSIRMSGVAA